MRAVPRQGLDGGDEAALDVGDPYLAASRRIAVDVNGACAAMAGAAAIFGAGKIGRVAQRPEQRRIGVHPVVDRLAVDGKAGHACQALRGETGRWKAKGSRST